MVLTCETNEATPFIKTGDNLEDQGRDSQNKFWSRNRITFEDICDPVSVPGGRTAVGLGAKGCSTAACCGGAPRP